MLRVVKPKSQRARRELEKRAPKLKENVKKALLLHGSASSQLVKNVLSDIHALKKDTSMLWTRKNGNIHPLEPAGTASLEFFSNKTDCSLFAFGTHTKKRPHNLVLGRMYDYHTYDLIEVGIERYKSIKDLAAGKIHSPQLGSKPCFVFIGEAFESNEKFHQMKELLLDFFRGEEVERINLAGLDRVIVCTACGEKVLFRHCGIRLMKSGTKVPRIELVDVGPSMDLVLRRNLTPGEELKKEAMMTVTKSKANKVKNVSSDSLHGRVGRIYMPKQEVDEIALKKMKGLKRERREAAGNEESRKKAREGEH